MDAIRETQKENLADPRPPAGAEVQARAQLALDITPKRFRLIVLAPLRLLDTLRDAFAQLLRLLF